MTITDAYPLPRIDDLLEKFRIAKWFTTIDLTSGYWQIEVKKEDKEKTVFIYKFINVYIDDIIIYSKNWDEHLQHIKIVLEELKKANMMLKLKKCEWAKRIKFVKGYLKIVKPIMELTRKNVPFVWTDKQQKALEELKEKLINYLILQHPNFEKEFILITDTSGEGLLEAILEQLDENNREIVISYASRSLVNAEKNYPITELKCLAVFWGIKYFHKYLFGRNLK
ncbi:retrovirus-related Pol polyprotein from transposon 412 [Rhizophagus irregularis DAOM 181602=DAOM 197198]|nr:retrovirus-related Pol polyprotein from transposon 412 [Rhizophagus irregularis DAOM 181602=DAOM 197198]